MVAFCWTVACTSAGLDTRGVSPCRDTSPCVAKVVPPPCPTTGTNLDVLPAIVFATGLS